MSESERVSKVSILISRHGRHETYLAGVQGKIYHSAFEGATNVNIIFLVSLYDEVQRGRLFDPNWVSDLNEHRSTSERIESLDNVCSGL